MEIKRQQTGVTLTVEEVKSFVFRLPSPEFIQLADEIRERAETMEMTRLAETGFAEWDEPGEGIYSVSNPLGLDTSLRSYSAGAEVGVGQKKALHLE
jgi:hypothetical protein